ncbi:hypothetical protein CBFG_01948 [Clostridiales bacterium 1_7_47FAA]|nr:hypothetical protein CBFG_01948 [Clostridiales bacterium 1_7_47FAA]
MGGNGFSNTPLRNLPEVSLGGKWDARLADAIFKHALKPGAAD